MTDPMQPLPPSPLEGAGSRAAARPGLWARFARFARRNPLLVVGLAIFGLFGLLLLFGGWITPHSPTATNPAKMLEPPSWEHPFGTDRFGRDVLARVVYGTRVSLGIAFASIGAALVVGSLTGLCAGFLSGAVDQFLSRLMDLFLAFPSVLLALSIAAVLGSGVGTVIIAIAIVYTPMFFRVVRSAVLVEREQVYVEAAEAFGGGAAYVMRRHILRNVVSPIVVQTAVSLSYAILIESALSYLGVGVQPPTPSWGEILNGGKEFIELAPWISIFPGFFIMLSVLAFNFISDGLRDLTDPRVRKA